MSRVQGKNTDLLNNLTDTGIANELDSHLRDLEKNIAVAREFIKLADESYSELRHKWNLIQEEARNKTGTGISEGATSSPKKTHRSQTKEHAKTADDLEPKTDEPAEIDIESSFKSTKSENPKGFSKHEKARKQHEEYEETPRSTGQLDKVTPSGNHGSKRRRDKSRSSTS